MSNMWMVRAGKGANYVEDFMEKEIVAIGWMQLGEIPNNVSRDELLKRANELWPNRKKGQIAIHVGQIFRFLTNFKLVIKF